MDKFKIVMKFVKKYLFWVCSVISLILIFVFWKQATGGLLDNFNTRKGEIEGKFTQMQSLAGAQNLPNAKVVAQKERALRIQSQNIYDAWTQLYNTQQQNNIWPITDERFRPEFETVVVRKLEDPNFELTNEVREHYGNYIKDHLRKIKAEFDIKRPKKEVQEAIDAAARGVSSPTRTTPVGRRGQRTAQVASEGTLDPTQLREDQLDGVVYWNDQNFRQLENRLTWQGVPTTRQILVAQEDLWIYEAILRVIKETNEGTSEYNANVKEIYAIDIAQDTVLPFEDAMSRVLKVPEVKAEMDEMGMAMPVETAAAEGDLTPSDDELEFDALYDERYVDAQGRHITSTQLRGEEGEGGAEGESQAIIVPEYKMVPIRIQILINQRAIAQLMVNCVNSKMPIEVLQISINPGRGRQLDLSAENRGTTTVRPRDRRRSGGTIETMQNEFTQDGNYTMDGAAGDRGRRANRGPNDVELELLGMIYIYNPPVREMFPALLEEEALEEDGFEGEEFEGEGEELSESEDNAEVEEAAAEASDAPETPDETASEELPEDANSEEDAAAEDEEYADDEYADDEYAEEEYPEDENAGEEYVEEEEYIEEEAPLEE
ncbi:MAG: hypothetical protein Q4D38_10985 [Planctomycetia bacterium]|nr:hypothetical protein [Planctomycetia bacterium]